MAELFSGSEGLEARQALGELGVDVLGEEVAEAPGGEGQGHDEVGVVGVGGAGGDRDARVAGL